MKPVHVLSCVASGVVLSLLGCWGLIQLVAPTPSGDVAVIDLNLVAQKLGRDQEIADALKSSDASLGQQLADYQSQLQQQLEAKKGETESPEPSRVELASYAQELGQQLKKARRTAQQSLVNHRRQLVLNFRQEVTPVAMTVARERGLSVVVVKNDALLTHEKQVDISDVVAQRMLTSTVEPKGM